MIYQLLADLVLALHMAIVLFVVLGLLLVVIGNQWHWAWVNTLWFRLLHLVAILIVMVQAWLGMHCPLTVLEMWLRVQARDTIYEESFVEHWLQRLLYFDAPMWVFAVAYTGFALLVLASWWRYPPRR